MRLEPKDAERFVKLHKGLLFYVNQRLHVSKEPIASSTEFAKQPLEGFVEVRQALLKRLDLIDDFAAENPMKFSKEDLEIVRSWKNVEAGKFIVFRYLKSHTIFLSTTKPVIAYGVLALNDPFEELLGPYLPHMVETALLPFEGRIVYDGMMEGYNLVFGGGYRRSFQDSYKEAKERFGIVTQLPFDPDTARKQKAAKPKPRSGRSTTALRGRWEFRRVERWDSDYAKAEVEGFVEFAPTVAGSFQLGSVQGAIDYRVAERDGKHGVEFSWKGQEGKAAAHGRGWAVRDGEDIEAMIFVHHGPEFGFRAKRSD
jgi:hypothetical protein